MLGCAVTFIVLLLAALTSVCFVVVAVEAASSLVAVPPSIVALELALLLFSIVALGLALLVVVDCVCSVVRTGASVPVSPPVSDVTGVSALLGAAVSGGATMRPEALTSAAGGALGP